MHNWSETESIVKHITFPCVTILYRKAHDRSGRIQGVGFETYALGLNHIRGIIGRNDVIVNVYLLLSTANSNLN